MDLISADDVIRRIETYLSGAESRLLRRVRAIDSEARATKHRAPYSSNGTLSTLTAPMAIENAIHQTEDYPIGHFEGRGIVIAAGGATYLACSWVCIRMLRKTGCKLPIEIWHLGDDEVPEYLKPLFTRYGVKFVDAQRVRKKFPARRLSGWPLKAYAILHSRFKEVCLLDADNVPLIDPTAIFETEHYRKNGAIFWPDLGTIGEDNPIWRICGVEYRNEPEIESGQLLVDKERSWRALSLAWWMNENADFFYHHMHGDKETFHMAFRRLGQPYAMPETRPAVIQGTLLQHDFEGAVIFQHRGTAKWTTTGKNPQVKGFKAERLCLRYLKELASSEPWRRFSAPKIAHQATTALPTGKKRAKSKLILRAPINPVTGYGLHACQIVSDFADAGVELQIVPTSISEKFAALPTCVKERLSHGDTRAKRELLLHPPFVNPLPGKRSIYFTMWETTHLPRSCVEVLNKAACVVVPCQWNRETFTAAGVSARIEVIPLGIKTDVFVYSPAKMEGPCVFGAAARLKDSDPARKRIDRVVHAFRKAFPTEKDVRLHIKLFPDCVLEVPRDERIQTTFQYLPEEEMSYWFRSLTCFVSASAAEGWGLMQHQALAVGRPIISALYGGVTEFVNSGNSYIVPHDEVPATGMFDGMGCWSNITSENIAVSMRQVYENRMEAQEKGLQGSLDVAGLTWKRSNSRLATLARSINFI